MESTAGRDLDGLDLDALRMYLRRRGLTLAEIREHPGELRDPATLPDVPNPPSGGAVAGDDLVGEPGTGAHEPSSDGGGKTGGPTAGEDPWGAAAFLDAIEGTAYGTTPAKLRRGLDVLATRDSVWVMPGIPLIIPVFLGLLCALTVGDLLFGLLGVIGLA
jgi:preflagellin peptidase FlaK